MKKLLLLSFVTLAAYPHLLQAQVPQAINYQAVIRDALGQPIDDNSISVRVQVFQNSTLVFDEKYYSQIANKGLVNLQIGMANPTDFAKIDWALGSYFIKIDYDLDNGSNWTNFNAAPVLTVPYAFYSQFSGNGYWVKTDTSLYYLDSYVGIGTKNPQAYLDVVSKSTPDKTVLARFLNPDENSLLINQYGGSTNLVQLAAVNSDQNLSLVTASSSSLNENTNTGIYIKSGGNVGIGTTDPQTQLHIGGYTDASLGGGGGVLIGQLNKENLVIDGNEIMARDNGHIGDLNFQNEGGDLRIHGNLSSNGAQVIIKDNGNLGIGTSNPIDKLHIVKENGFAQLRLERTGGGSNDGYAIIGGAAGGFYVGHFKSSGSWETDFQVDHNGMAYANCLTIRGCDWYEFSKSAETLLPGELAVIDPNGDINAVRRSNRAYDPSVVGVVSGAGGINPGIGLTQPDILDGDTKIAMGGKVMVRVIGKVKPGDMLTSSGVPGCAMAAKNRKKAFGAVIGKALSKPNADGLVLMLVMMR